jgi:hypothetical protein
MFLKKSFQNIQKEEFKLARQKEEKMQKLNKPWLPEGFKPTFHANIAYYL